MGRDARDFRRSRTSPTDRAAGSAGPPSFPPLVPALFQDRVQGAGVGGGLEETAYRLLRRVAGRLGRAPAAGDVERHGVRNKLRPLLPDLDGHINGHAPMVAYQTRRP